jgi:intein/homing endonuclease
MLTITVSVSFKRGTLYTLGTANIGGTYETGDTSYEYIEDTTGCLVAGTLILMSNYGYKKIEDIKAGDYVMSYNLQTKTYEPAITKRGAKLFAHRHKIVDIYLNNGCKLTMTPGHPVLTLNGWKSLSPAVTYREHNLLGVKMLNVFDYIKTTEGYASILSIQYKDNPQQYNTYNIDVPKNQTYIANGVITHNAGGENK